MSEPKIVDNGQLWFLSMSIRRKGSIVYHGIYTTFPSDIQDAPNEMKKFMKRKYKVQQKATNTKKITNRSNTPNQQEG